MKFTSELKIGITGLITIIVIIWGVNYLKGRNILSSNYKLYSMYQEVDGLEASAGVILNGFKIGMVSDVAFDTEKAIPFTISMEIDKKYKLPKGSTAEIFSADLLGSKSLRIIPSENEGYHSSGDTLKSSLSIDMISSLLNDIKPLTEGLSAAIQTLDSAGSAINMLLRDPSVSNMMDHLENASSSLEGTLAETGDFSKTIKNLKNISRALELQSSAIQTSISNVESITTELKNADLDSLIQKLSVTGSNLAEITSAIENGNGSLGKLIYEDSLYNQINLLVTDLDSLINDINENPKKYVSISLFGK